MKSRYKEMKTINGVKLVISAVLIGLLVLSPIDIYARDWTADVLGADYEQTTVNMADDYSGKVRCTVVKKSAEGSTKAVLYVHGYNDYFFQKEMSDRFVAEGYNFYAVDLRKYGRSLLPEQRRFEVHNIDEYYADIDTAINVALEDGNKDVILMGHSTGGLTLSCYMASGAGDKYPIKALLLNSPFLDMNLSSFNENVAVPFVSWMSSMFKDIEINQGNSNSYAQSLLKKYHGEWGYNTSWKLEISPAVTSGWLGAIHKAHVYIQKGANIKCPVLLMRSDKSIDGDGWNPSYNRGDAVLDVNDISRYGRKLGKNVTEFIVKDGLHDLFLSRKPVRYALYINVFEWLREKGL